MCFFNLTCFSSWFINVKISFLPISCDRIRFNFRASPFWKPHLSTLLLSHIRLSKTDGNWCALRQIDLGLSLTRPSLVGPKKNPVGPSWILRKICGSLVSPKKIPWVPRGFEENSRGYLVGPKKFSIYLVFPKKTGFRFKYKNSGWWFVQNNIFKSQWLKSLARNSPKIAMILRTIG